MGRTVPAVMRALDILELFLDGAPHSAPDITTRIGLPRTSVHELVTTLAQRGYLVAAPGRPGHYRLGVPLFHLGSVFAEQVDLAREGKEVVAQVAAECAETAQIAVLDGTNVVYVAKVDGTHPVRLVSSVGRRLPAHCTAVGKMLLSALPEDEFDVHYPRGVALPAMTPHSITSVELLSGQLTEIRKRGIATEYCESNPDVACVAAPIRDSSGAVVAALSVSVPTQRWTDSARFARYVTDGATELGARLGYRAR
ncbi:MAG TPA: IclR family transcriptional regulator [Pseudonocardiaceae bacterium]